MSTGSVPVADPSQGTASRTPALFSSFLIGSGKFWFGDAAVSCHSRTNIMNTLAAAVRLMLSMQERGKQLYSAQELCFTSRSKDTD